MISRMYFKVVFLLFLFVFFIAFFLVKDERPDDSTKSLPCPDDSFYTAALATGTDKVHPHHYEFAYADLLRPIRCNELTVLEIGLGCDGGVSSAGSSAKLWLDFLPRVQLTVLEYNEACATEWLARDARGVGAAKLEAQLRIFTGDQSNVGVLLPMAQIHGPFDFIIDDGGHTYKQQLVSLRTLLPFVKPGGFYVLEDVQTSFSSRWRDFKTTTVEYLTRLMDVLHEPSLAKTTSEDDFPGLLSLVPLTQSVSCFREMCVIRVFASGAWPLTQPPS